MKANEKEMWSSVEVYNIYSKQVKAKQEKASTS